MPWNHTQESCTSILYDTMYKFNSQSKGLGETFEVVLSGGSPWGFTLQGGSEFRTKLSVSKITPGGKADLSQAIVVGDEIVAINGIECQSRAEAIELVRCSRQKLKIALRREGGFSPVNQSNGAVIKKKTDVPNLYKTASELLSSSDFYSTFNVDKKKFAEITQNKKASNIYDSTDNLSASHENLLESYRQAEIQPNISNSSIMEETSERLSRSSTEIANGRTSPAETDGLRRINSLNNVTGKRFHSSTGLLGAAQFNRPGEVYGRTWSLRRGVSLPEGHWPVVHQRTYTSPGRIQKVMVKSTNIAVSPTGREAENQQTARSSVNSKNPDDWVGRWLMDSQQQQQQQQKQQQQHGAHQPGSVNQGLGSSDYKDVPDRRISLQERSDLNKSQSLPRSKSFGGPTSYGVTVTATAVKWNDSNNRVNHPRAPQRYSSSNLMQEKQVRDVRPDDTSPRQSEKLRNSLVFAAPGDTVEVRLPRDMMGPKMTTSESTSSLDSVGTMDSSVGGARRQGPAPPPRRSVSKLLSSFRTSDRRRPPEEVQIPARFGAVARIPEIAADQPKHSVSRSWPTDHVGESKPAGSDVTNRQSWHAEPAVMPDYGRRQANSSTSSASGDVTPERKLSKSSSLRYSSSVVIRNMRSSSSSSMDEKSSGPTVYRSGQAAPEVEQTYPENQSSTLPARKKLSDVSPPVNVGRWPPQNERETERSRIEDTQILQRLMKDNAANVETSPSVKSRIANFEGGVKQVSPGAPAQERPRFPQQRSFSQGRIDISQQPLKESHVSQSSSMDSLLDTRSPTRISSSSTSTERQRSPIQSDTRPTKYWETINDTERDRPGENYKRLSSYTYSVKNNAVTREPVRDIEPSSPISLERQQSFEDESSAHVENKVNSAMERTAPVNDRGLLISNILESDLNRKPAEEDPHPPISSNDDNDVFWDTDDSLPPPPPMDAVDPLETSHDSLPLPSPPREVLVEFPSSYNDCNSRQNNPDQKETFQQNGEDSSDIIKPEETPVVESSVEIDRGPKIELNGPGKVDTSGVSDQPFETSSSTDFSSRETSPAENKTKSNQKAPPPAPLIITSTPTKDEPDERGPSLDVSTSPYSAGSNTSTPSSSRPNSMLSPKLEALDKEKADLVDSMKQKIVDLRSQMDEIKDEIDGNEELGRKVTKVVERKANANEFSKYQLFTGELNKIIGLLLILTQRMHRYEMMLNDLDMSEEADRQQKDILLEKIEKVTMQHEEACKIKEVNDKRGEVVSKILENCLEEEEFADFQYYIDMKTQLALMHAEIRDKVKMGEERLNTLHSTKIDWSILSLT